MELDAKFRELGGSVVDERLINATEVPAPIPNRLSELVVAKAMQQDGHQARITALSILLLLLGFASLCLQLILGSTIYFKHCMACARYSQLFHCFLSLFSLDQYFLFS